MLPRDAIEKIDGFCDLPKRAREALLKDPRNYQPMVESANCSKGCKVERLNGGWNELKQIPVDSEYKKNLGTRQDAFQDVVEKVTLEHQEARR